MNEDTYCQVALGGRHPGAVSILFDELASGRADVPEDRHVSLYRRGAFCRPALDAARLMQGQGIDAWPTEDGVLKWRRAGGSVDLTAAG